MAKMLSAKQLHDAEVGCRLLNVRIHDLCRYVRGEVRPFSSYEQSDSFSEWFADNTLPAQRELESVSVHGRRDSNATLVARHLFSRDMAEHLAAVLAGRVPPVEYRTNYKYLTAFAATTEIAFDVATAFNDHCIAEWEEDSEEVRHADCDRFRTWINQNVPPSLLWGLWQRIEQERNLYLRWAADQGMAIEYDPPGLSSIDHAIASAMNVNPHVLLFGEAMLRRDVDSWDAFLESESTSTRSDGENARKSKRSTTKGDDLAKPRFEIAADSDAILLECTPSLRNAYLSFKYAERKNEKQMEDRPAHDWLKEQGCGDIEGLADYDLPAFDTWCRYVRDVRNKLGEQKYQLRAGRVTGGSVVRATDL